MPIHDQWIKALGLAGSCFQTCNAISQPTTSDNQSWEYGITITPSTIDWVRAPIRLANRHKRSRSVGSSEVERSQMRRKVAHSPRPTNPMTSKVEGIPHSLAHCRMA